MKEITRQISHTQISLGDIILVYADSATKRHPHAAVVGSVVYNSINPRCKVTEVVLDLLFDFNGWVDCPEDLRYHTFKGNQTVTIIEYKKD